MISALFVETGGSYFNQSGIDPWDEARDARRYTGPHPVIAHPPCQRWGKLWAGSPSWIARTGERKIKGDDHGCFASALDSVRRYGGVLEHPWGSHAWQYFGLNVPPRAGGWIAAELPGSHKGWTCCVEQGQYGHYARKPTLLYAVGTDLPNLKWGHTAAVFPDWAIARYGLQRCKRMGELSFRGGGKDNSHRIGTPPEFRALLIDLAKSTQKVSA